jgi:hypothetical protein
LQVSKVQVSKVQMSKEVAAQIGFTGDRGRRRAGERCDETDEIWTCERSNDT